MNTTPYLTPTVKGLINEIRQKQDYSICPILADALQDVGFDDAPEEIRAVAKQMLKNLRLDTEQSRTESKMGYPFLQQRTICLLLGGEYKESLDWIDELIMEMRRYGNTTFSHLIQHAINCVAKGEWGEPSHGFVWTDLFEEKHEEFWKHFEVVTGIPIKDKSRDDLYDCSC